jgi:hypothetical protein
MTSYGAVSLPVRVGVAEFRVDWKLELVFSALTALEVRLRPCGYSVSRAVFHQGEW